MGPDLMQHRSGTITQSRAVLDRTIGLGVSATSLTPFLYVFCIATTDEHLQTLEAGKVEDGLVYETVFRLTAVGHAIDDRV